MAEEASEILKQFTELIVPELKEAAGSFGDTIKTEVSEKGFEITISSLVNVLIDGRPPTSSGASAGNPTLQQSILSWIQSKGIAPRANARGVTPSVQSLSWAISKSIHRDGTKLYQQGGGNNIFEGIITDQRIDSLLNLVGAHYFNRIKKINFEEIIK